MGLTGEATTPSAQGGVLAECDESDVTKMAPKILIQIRVCRLFALSPDVNPLCKRDVDRGKIRVRHEGVSGVCEALPTPWLSDRLCS